MQTGRPTDYKDEYCEQAKKLCLLGATDKQLADFFSVTEQTVNNWKNDHPEFFESLKEGKQLADAKVAESLYNRARGYEHTEDKVFNDNGTPMVVPTIKHYPPDSTACIFWLKNRDPEKWRDKTHLDHNINETPKLEISVNSKEDADNLRKLTGEN